MLNVFQWLYGKATSYIQEIITPSKGRWDSNKAYVLKFPKFKHDTFSKAASGMGLLGKEYYIILRIRSVLTQHKDYLIWQIIIKHPRVLSAQLVAQYQDIYIRMNGPIVF